MPSPSLREFISTLSAEPDRSERIPNWLNVCSQSDLFVKEIANGLDQNPLWLDDNPDFLKVELPKLYKNDLIGRTPLIYLLNKMGQIPTEERSSHFTEHVDTVLKITANSILARRSGESSEDSPTRTFEALLHISTNRGNAEKTAALLTTLGDAYREIGQQILDACPAPLSPPKVKKPPSLKQQSPKQQAQRERSSFTLDPQHSVVGQKFLASFPQIVQEPDRKEKLSELSNKAALLIPELNLYDVATIARRFEINFYCANEFFKVAQTFAKDHCFQMEETPNSFDYNAKSNVIQIHSTLTNFHFSCPALNSAMHDAFKSGTFDINKNAIQQLVISFANHLQEEEFTAAWQKSIELLNEAGPSSPKYVAAGAIRGMTIPGDWKFIPLEPQKINPADILNSFERGIYESLVRIRTQHNLTFEIQPEYEIGGFSIDMVMDKEGRRYGIECDGVHFHYIHHRHKSGMLWDEYVREHYIQYTLGIPLIRIPSSEWPYNKARQDAYLEKELRKLSPAFF